MSRTILLADDSLTIQKVVELTFADTDYDVISLSSGDDLLQKLDEVSPDLVICDIIMPGRDGYDVCQEIKSDPATLHIPVILLSGTFEPFDRDRALAAGCSEIITKPFEARKLVDTVEKLLVGQIPDAGVAARATTAAPPDVAAAPDPDMQTLESFPAYTEQMEDAVEEALDAEELPESSLDFTDTGFAEMEEAAQRGAQRRAEPPEEGLEFEFSDEHDAFGAPDTPELPHPSETRPEFGVGATAEATTDTDLFAGAEAAESHEAFDDLREIPEFEHMAEAAAESSGVAATEPVDVDSEDREEPSVEGPFVAEEPPDVEREGPFPTADTPEEILGSGATADEPFASDSAVEPAPHDRAPIEELVSDEPATADVDVEESFLPSPETVEIPQSQLPIDEPSVEPEREVAVHVEFEREIEIEPELEPRAPEELPAEEEETPPTPGAETGPFAGESIAGVAEPTAAGPDLEEAAVSAVPEDALGRLSDEDVDRVARRVLELASDRFEQLAWEIVPDMAEVAVRQRIRELEAEIEESSDDDSR